MGSKLSAASNGREGFVKDEGGAIMIMGLAMILGLIAFLWFLLGIGETLAFRDHMQDSADAAAFSQSAVEAAGMNLIVLINMLLMLLVIVYLIASILLTIYWGIMVGELATCPESVFVCADGIEMLAEYPGLYDDRGDLGSALSYIDEGLSLLESGVAVISPWAGTAAGIDASTSYKMGSMTGNPWGLAIGPTNFPDLDAITSIGKSTTAEYGLPVTHEHLGNDCAHLIDMTGGLISGLLGGKGGSLINSVAGALGTIVQWYYCDHGTNIPIKLPGFIKTAMKYLSFLPMREIIGGGDNGSYWVNDGYGPMENYNHVNVIVDDIQDGMKGTKARHDKEQKNGADHNQSFSFVVVPSSYSDHHAMHNIKFMQLHTAGWSAGADTAPTTMVGAIFYFAQAELFFDCDKGWRSPDCDDIANNNDHVDQVMYEFGWRARLVKFHAAAGSSIGKVLDVINKGLGMVTDVKGWINGGASNPFIKALSFLDELTGINIIGFIGSIADIPPTQIFH